MRLRLKVVACWIGLMSIPAVAQNSASCQQFVQKFYDWYVPSAAKASFDVGIERKPEVFSPELLKALKEDAAARKRVSDDIVGLDFDPYLYTQDPSARYEARGGEFKDKTCLVEVSSASKKSGAAKVIAELRVNAASWQFTNFRYPGDKTDLLRVLQQLARERQPQKRK